MKNKKDESVAKQIHELHSQSNEELKRRYETLYNNPPPPLMSNRILIQRIAYKIQEKVFGGISPQCLKLLVAELNGPPEGASPLISGTRLVRLYKGVRHEVTVRDGGVYSYANVDYSSLSAIATLITGQKRNGREFFNVKA